MSQTFDILFSGEYITPFSSPRSKQVNRNFGFRIRNEFEDNEDFQQEPYLTMAKEKIIKRLEKKGYMNIVITSIEAVSNRKKKKGRSGINKLAKRLLSL